MITVELRRLTDRELHERTHQCAKREQQATLDLLMHLQEVDSRQLHAKMGYEGVWEYAVRELGYSEPAASERVQAMRLLAAVPEAKAKLAAGEINLSTAAAVHRHIRAEKKHAKRVLSAEEKAALVSDVAGKSVQETKRILLDKATVPQASFPERERPISSTRTELRFTIDQETQALLDRVREIKGRGCTLEEIMAQALRVYVKKIDPVQTSEVKGTPPGETSMSPAYVPIALKKYVATRSRGRCEYVSTAGRRCHARHRLQVDHIVPKAKGGRTEAGNLRHLCPAHNRFEAIREFGWKKMRPYVNPDRASGGPPPE